MVVFGVSCRLIQIESDGRRKARRREVTIQVPRVPEAEEA